ncbi:MAG TPA: hypothetical protein VIK84_07215 [Haloplasmataceae bacterium]
MEIYLIILGSILLFISITLFLYLEIDNLCIKRYKKFTQDIYLIGTNNFSKKQINYLIGYLDPELLIFEDILEANLQINKLHIPIKRIEKYTNDNTMTINNLVIEARGYKRVFVFINGSDLKKFGKFLNLFGYSKKRIPRKIKKHLSIYNKSIFYTPNTKKV